MRTLDDTALALIEIGAAHLPADMLDSFNSDVRSGEAIEAVEDILVEFKRRNVLIPLGLLADVERMAPEEWRPPQDEIITKTIEALRAHPIVVVHSSHATGLLDTED